MTSLTVRVDKWLQVARVFKTRTQATQACKLGRVRINGESAKPHRNLSVEDRIEVKQGDWARILVVKALRGKTVPKSEARTLYEDLTPPRPKDERKRIIKTSVFREKGKGRPTKKERRQIERFKRGK